MNMIEKLKILNIVTNILCKTSILRNCESNEILNLLPVSVHFDILYDKQLQTTCMDHSCGILKKGFSVKHYIALYGRRNSVINHKSLDEG